MKNQDAINATNFLRRNYPNVSQRQLAKLIDQGLASNLPGWSGLEYDQQVNVVEAVRTAGDTSTWATIYGRIRRYDAAVKQAQSQDTAFADAEVADQQPVGV